MSRLFYQSHSCEGFNAKVTIEWDIPATTEETLIKNRIAAAEDIADDILRFSGSKMRDMVQAMRGITKSAHDATYLRGWNEGIKGAAELLDNEGSGTPAEKIRTLIEL